MIAEASQIARLAGLMIAVAAGFVLVGCSDYLDRRETVSLGAGNAQQANLITHVINPLPPHAANRQLLFNGQLIQRVFMHYRTGEVEEVVAPPTDD